MLVAFDGVDGVGKSTIIQEIANNLALTGIPVIHISECKGDRFREALWNSMFEHNNCLTLADELDIINVLRRHTHRIYGKMMQSEDIIVLLDRYLLSTLVYQCMDGGLDKGELTATQIERTREMLRLFNREMFCVPDIYFYLTAEPEVIAQRSDEREKTKRYDEVNIEKIKERQSKYELAANLYLSCGFGTISKINNNDTKEKTWDGDTGRKTSVAAMCTRSILAKR